MGTLLESLESSRSLRAEVHRGIAPTSTPPSRWRTAIARFGGAVARGYNHVDEFGLVLGPLVLVEWRWPLLPALPFRLLPDLFDDAVTFLKNAIVIIVHPIFTNAFFRGFQWGIPLVQFNASISHVWHEDLHVAILVVLLLAVHGVDPCDLLISLCHRHSPALTTFDLGCRGRAPL